MTMESTGHGDVSKYGEQIDTMDPDRHWRPDDDNEKDATIARLTRERDDLKTHHNAMTAKWVAEMQHWKARAEAAEAELARVRHELVGMTQGRDNMKEMWGLAHDAANKAEAERDRLRRQVSVLRGALRHGEGCYTYGGPNAPCTCGLDDELAEAEGKEFMGMPVKVDPTMPPGTWRLETEGKEG